MKPFERIKLVSELLDLAIVDKDERSCGVVDDVEFSGSPGREMRVKALLVGPGAYCGRMPSWLYWAVRKVAGNRMARVPAADVAETGRVVKLRCAAEKLKLHEAENQAARWLPHWGAL